MCAQPSPAALCFSSSLRRGSVLASCFMMWATGKMKAQALKTCGLGSPDEIQQKSLAADLTRSLANIYRLFPCRRNSCLLRKATCSANDSYFQSPVQPQLVCDTDLKNNCDNRNMICSLCHFLWCKCFLHAIIKTPMISNWKFVPVTVFTHCPHPSPHNPISGNHQSIFYFYKFGFFVLDSTYKWNHTIFTFLGLMQIFNILDQTLHSNEFRWYYVCSKSA